METAAKKLGRPVTTPGVTAPYGTTLYYKQRYDANRERYSAMSNARQLRRKLRWLGLAQEDYESLMALGCSVCGALNSGKRRLHIDHDHGTGEFRGLLCSNCNTTLGLCADDAVRLRKLADYVETNFARNAAKWSRG